MCRGVVWLTCEFLIKLRDNLRTSLGFNHAKNSIDFVFHPITAFFGLRRSEMQEDREPADLPEQL
jgi:hypothetical protein